MDRQVWTETATFDVGGLHLGVRSSNAEFDQLLRETLRAHLVEGGEAPPNFSVKLADANKRNGPVGFHLLYRSSSVQLRTRDPQRLVRGLFAHLASYRKEQLRGFLGVQGVGLVSERGAVIAPTTLRQIRAQIERRLNELGVRFIDDSFILMDWKSHEVVVPEPFLEIDWSALDRLDKILPGGRPDPPVPPGRYPLIGWAFFAHGEERLTRGQALALGVRSTFGDEALGMQPTLDALADVMRNIEPVSVAWSTPAELASRFAEIGTNR